MKALKETLYNWLKTRTGPVTFRQICEHFKGMQPWDIKDILDKWTDSGEIKIYPTRYELVAKSKD